MTIEQNPLTDLLTEKQKTALSERGVGILNTIRLFWHPIVGIIAEAQLVEDDSLHDATRTRKRVLQVSSTGVVWDEYWVDEQGLEFP